MPNRVKEDYAFYADDKSECHICGIRSFSHMHLAGSLPKEFVRSLEEPKTIGVDLGLPGADRSVETLWCSHGDKTHSMAEASSCDLCKRLEANYPDSCAPTRESEQKFDSMLADIVFSNGSDEEIKAFFRKSIKDSYHMGMEHAIRHISKDQGWENSEWFYRQYLLGDTRTLEQFKADLKKGDNN